MATPLYVLDLSSNKSPCDNHHHQLVQGKNSDNSLFQTEVTFINYPQKGSLSLMSYTFCVLQKQINTIKHLFKEGLPLRQKGHLLPPFFRGTNTLLSVLLKFSGCEIHHQKRKICVIRRCRSWRTESSSSQIRNNLSPMASGNWESGTLLNVLLTPITSWKLKSQAHAMLSFTRNRY